MVGLHVAFGRERGEGREAPVAVDHLPAADAMATHRERQDDAVRQDRGLQLGEAFLAARLAGVDVVAGDERGQGNHGRGLLGLRHS